MQDKGHFPHNLEIEKALLGCLIADEDSFYELSAHHLKSTDFYSPIHGEIFSAITQLHFDLKAIDYLTIANQLQMNNSLEKVGGKEYIISLFDQNITSAHVEEYAKVLKDFSKRREIIKSMQKLTDLSWKYDGQAVDLISTINQSMIDICDDSAVENSSVELKNSMQIVLDSLQEGAISETDSYLYTDFTKLDNYLNGLEPGQLIVLAARPGVGKTSFALNLATNVARKEKGEVIIFSLEMTQKELSKRILSSEAEISSKSLKNGNLSIREIRKVSTVAGQIGTLPITINDRPLQNCASIRSEAIKVKIRKREVGLIVVDYLQLLELSTGRQNKVDQIGDATRALKLLAKELSCPVVILSQLNRAIENRENKRPTLSDLRDSGSIEQDADIVLFLSKMDSEKERLLFIAKNRNGEVGQFKIGFKGEFTKFTNEIEGEGNHGSSFYNDPFADDASTSVH